MKHSLAGICVLLSLILSGCGSSRSGHLMIAGGATEPDNSEIYTRFMAPLAPDAVIGVLPTASGVPKESAASSAATLTRYAGARRVEIIDLTTQNPQEARNPDVVDRINKCSALWYTGGDQKRIVTTFRPRADQTVDSPAYHATRRLLARGGVIGGTSAGAAMMSDPMILGGRSDDALSGKTHENSDETGFGVGLGMGYFPFGLTDQHFLRRGRLGRLVVALELAGLPRGYGIEENAAMDVDLSTGLITVLGPDAAVVLVDTSEMKRDGPARFGLRVSLLFSDDVVDGATGVVMPRWPKRSTEQLKQLPSDAPPASPPDAWHAGAVTWAFRRLVAEPSQPIELHSPSFDVQFQADDRTHFFQNPDSPQHVTVIAARMNIVPSRNDPPE